MNSSHTSADDAELRGEEPLETEPLEPPSYTFEIDLARLGKIHTTPSSRRRRRRAWSPAYQTACAALALTVGGVPMLVLGGGLVLVNTSAAASAAVCAIGRASVERAHVGAGRVAIVAIRAGGERRQVDPSGELVLHSQLVWARYHNYSLFVAATQATPVPRGSPLCSEQTMPIRFLQAVLLPSSAGVVSMPANVSSLVSHRYVLWLSGDLLMPRLSLGLMHFLHRESASASPLITTWVSTEDERVGAILLDLRRNRGAGVNGASPGGPEPLRSACLVDYAVRASGCVPRLAPTDVRSPLMLLSRQIHVKNECERGAILHSCTAAIVEGDAAPMAVESLVESTSPTNGGELFVLSRGCAAHSQGNCDLKAWLEVLKHGADQQNASSIHRPHFL